MDELLSKALEKRDKILAELDILNRFIDSYGKTLSSQESAVVSPSQLPLWAGREGPRAKHAAEIKETIDAAEEIILENQRPMTRGELVPILMSRGFKIHGRDKSRVFGTNMWRSGRFDNIVGSGYWPKGYPLPEVFF